jgi:hypothetical protein
MAPKTGGLYRHPAEGTSRPQALAPAPADPLCRTALARVLHAHPLDGVGPDVFKVVGRPGRQVAQIKTTEPARLAAGRIDVVPDLIHLHGRLIEPGIGIGVNLESQRADRTPARFTRRIHPGEDEVSDCPSPASISVQMTGNATRRGNEVPQAPHYHTAAPVLSAIGAAGSRRPVASLMSYSISCCARKGA